MQSPQMKLVATGVVLGALGFGGYKYFCSGSHSKAVTKNGGNKEKKKELIEVLKAGRPEVEFQVPIPDPPKVDDASHRTLGTLPPVVDKKESKASESSPKKKPKGDKKSEKPKEVPKEVHH
jgi:hypothetical protein